MPIRCNQTPPDDYVRITIEEAVRDFLADEKRDSSPRRRHVRAEHCFKSNYCRGLRANHSYSLTH
jgi:hypothetical protein